MTEIRFDGRVVIVTGAGRGIGRAVAELLADRGAQVVVNDRGGSVDGVGGSQEPADEVVSAIVSAGGRAVASAADIGSEVGAQSVVDSALASFGRVDGLVNCAGIIRPDSIEDLQVQQFDDIHRVHVGGSVAMTRAVWPHMQRQGYGRIALAISAGFLGSPGALSYATAKGGIFSFGRSVARSGQDHDIKVNLFLPSAQTRMIGLKGVGDAAGRSSAPPRAAKAAPEMVAALPAYLVHDAVPVTGETFSVTGTNVARIYVAETRGLSVGPDGQLDLETVSAQWAAVMDGVGAATPVDSADHGAFRKKVADEVVEVSAIGSGGGPAA